MKEINQEIWLEEISKYDKGRDFKRLTDEQKKFLLLARSKELSFPDIAKAMNNIFGKNDLFDSKYLSHLHMKLKNNE